MAEEKTGLLGQLLTSPFRLANLPFKSYRQYYGKPKKGETYTGSLIQKQRVKKLIPLVLGGFEIKENDKKFLDLFNDFLTSENHSPVDQSDVTLKFYCKYDCDERRYTYRNRPVTSFKDKESKEEKKSSIVGVPTGSYMVYFNNALKVRNTSITFERPGPYGLILFKTKKTKEGLELYFTNQTLDRKDLFLIFITQLSEPIGRIDSFEVYMDNKKIPFREPEFLGNVSAKISKK